jgi:hypothetical protein
MSTHTPGPWRTRNVDDHMYLDADTWDAFARVVVVVDDEPDPEGEANARLIAAAPEMLEALKEAVDDLRGPAETKALAAIAKAEGRE